MDYPPSKALPNQKDLRTRLKAAHRAVTRLEGERDLLEATVVRLGTLANVLDAEVVAQGVTETARQLTGASLAMFVPAELTEFSQPVVVCEPGALREVPEPAKIPLLAGALWRVTPLRLDDAAQWDTDHLYYGRLADGRSLRSWVGAPVRARFGNALGVLFLAHHDPNAFGKRDEELAQGLATHLGAYLDNINLSEERARVARALQQTLLPPVLPEIPGLEIAARYRPAKSVADVGGDFYDMFEVRPGVWGLILGDVCGVGPEAAALTGVARYAARALASQERSPARLLSQLNETLVRLGLQDRFCTALYAELRLKGTTVQLKIANGGHPYPFVMHADGRVEEITVQGTLLGVVANVALDERELTLAPGDALVSFTDGVIEARNPNGEFFGTEGLARVLPECAGGRAATTARHLELAVLEFQAGGAPDDLAIVVLQATGGRPGGHKPTGGTPTPGTD